MSICNLCGSDAQFARNACTISAVVLLNLSGEAALAGRYMQWVTLPLRWEQITVHAGALRRFLHVCVLHVKIGM